MSKSYQLKAVILGVDKLSPKLKELRAKLGSFQRDMRGAGKGALPMAAGLGVGIGVIAKQFAEAENAAVGLEVSMMKAGGKVAPEFKKIAELASGLGNKLPGTTADFQDMMSTLIQQGIPAQNILGGVGEASAYLAVQLKKAPAEAAEFAAKMQDATKTVSGDMLGLMDVIQRTFYLGVEDNNMLAAFTKLSPVLDMIKKKGLEGAAAMAPLVVMMDQAGMKGESSGNAIRKMFQSGFDAKKVKKVNAATGLGLDFTDGKGEFGGMENMFAQVNKLKSLSTQKKTGILKTLFGDDAETLQVVSVMIDKGLDGYKDVEARMASQASLQERVNKQLGTLANLWDAATGTFTNALVGFGEAISPELKSLTGFLGNMSEKLQQLSKDSPGLIRGLAAAAIGLTAFKLAALGAGFAMKILSGLMTMSPLGIFIRVMVIGAALIIANWDKIKTFFVGFAEKTKAIFSDLWGYVKGAISLSSVGPVGIIIKVWGPVIDWFKGMWERIRPYVEPLMNFFSSGKSISGTVAIGAAPSGRNGGARPSLVQQQAQAGRQQLNGQLDVRFENAPAGMRVAPAKTSQPGVRVMPNVGYSPFAWQGA